MIQFGTQYERFPNPRPEDWERDLLHMKQLGFDLIRTWMYWRIVNPEPGVWDFSHYDALFDLAQTSGIRVQIQLFLESPPEHLVQEHPEWLYENRKGEYQELMAIPAQQVGGYCGFDYMKSEPRAHAEEYIRQVVLRFQGHPALWGYDVWNEIWLSCWLDSAACNLRRSRFLQNKYQTVTILNEAHVARYRSFDDAADPRQATDHGGKKAVSVTHLDNMDAMEFENVISAEMMDWRAAVVRQYDLQHPVVSHIGSSSGNGHELRKNSWELSRALDAWGISIHEGDLYKFLLPMHVSKTTAGDKPWWLAENSSGSMWMGLNSRKRSAIFLQSTLTIALMLQTTGIMFWQYRPEIKDGESPNFGLVTLDGQDTDRSRITADFVRFCKTHEKLLDQAEPIHCPAGLVYSMSGSLFDAVADCNLHADFYGWYAALCQNGCMPQLMRDTDLTQGIPQDIRLLVLPMQVIELEGLRQSLRSWVESGGVLVASGQTFLYDHQMYAQRQYPGVDLFGVRENETDLYDGTVRYFRDSIDFDFPAGGRRIDCNMAGAYVIGAAEDGKALVTMQRLGKGSSVWFGCSPGRAHHFSVCDGLKQVVSDLLAAAGISSTISCTQGVVSQAHRCSQGYLLYVVNLTGSAVTTWIRLDFGQIAHVYDLLEDKQMDIQPMADRFLVNLLADQSKILHIHLDLCESSVSGQIE